MALSKEQRAEIDARYAEKVRARAVGEAPVFVAVAPLPVARTREELDTRAQLKLARHFAAPDKGEDGKLSTEGGEEKPSKPEKSGKPGKTEKPPAPDKGEDGK